MAKKTRKQKQRSAARRPQAVAPVHPAGPGSVRPAAVPAEPGDVSAVSEGSEPAWPATSTAASTALEAEPARRRVGRIQPATPVSAAAQRQQRAATKSARFGTAAAMVEPLDSDDPAIPFDRVPYVPADLRRVAMIAGLMVVLILIAWAIVTHVVD